MRTPRELIVKLLRNLGGRKEVEQYLKQFSSVEEIPEGAEIAIPNESTETT